MKCLVYVFLGVGHRALEDTSSGAQFKAIHLLLGLTRDPLTLVPASQKSKIPPQGGLQKLLAGQPVM